MPRLTCALGPDNVGAILEGLIASTAKRLDVAAYEAGPHYTTLLTKAAKRGVEVQLLLSGVNSEINRWGLDRLKGSTVVARVVDLPHAQAHWKMLISEQTLAIGSGNLIENEAPFGKTPLGGTREWWVAVSDAKELINAAVKRFTTTWERGHAPLSLGPVDKESRKEIGKPRHQVGALDLVVPERDIDLSFGGSACHAMLAAAIAGSSRDIRVITPYIFTLGPRVRELLTALAAAKDRGATVRILLGRVPTDPDAAGLNQLGFEARAMNWHKSTVGHAKGMVVDDSVIVGSTNWSEPALSANEEAMIRVNQADAAAYFGDCFDRDWETADPL